MTAFPNDWLHIRNWERYQSSSKRQGGPWIKLWHTIFSDRAFLSMPRATRYDWIAVLSLSGHQTHPGWIPNDSHLVARLIQGGRDLDLQLFVNLGLLEKTDPPDKIIEDKKREENTTLSPHKSAAVRDTYPPDFETFWKSYPELGRKEKPEALKAWNRISQRPPIDTLLQSIEAHKKTTRWKDGYVLYAARFLKRRCWEDAVSQSDMAERDGYVASKSNHIEIVQPGISYCGRCGKTRSWHLRAEKHREREPGFDGHIFVAEAS